MKPDRRLRWLITAIILVIAGSLALLMNPDLYHAVLPNKPAPPTATDPTTTPATGSAADALRQLAVKGRAPKTDYSRAQFGSGWQTVDGCDTRNLILQRDLVQVTTNQKCQVVTGTLHDVYTGTAISFTRGEISSQRVQIDHVVALSNAWQTGAQQLTPAQREAFANDPLELLAVDDTANQQKSDGDAATWLPPNKAFRCQYVARQVAVKAKYQLWVTPAEKDVINRILATCPDQPLPTP